MEWERFTCCQKIPHFEKIRDGYRCADCGKIFPHKTIDYLGEHAAFGKLKYRSKFRGFETDYIRDAGLFATLKTGTVSIIQMDDQYKVMDTKAIKVKKAAAKLSLNLNNTFLTITQSGIIDVYSSDTQEAVAQFKTVRIKDNSYHDIKACPLGTDGRWLLVDREKISCCSNDFKECQTLLFFRDVVKGNVLSIKSADCNLGHDCFAVHINYWIDSHYIGRASFIIDCRAEKYDIRHTFYAPETELTYDFGKHIYHGVYHDKMLMMDEQGRIEEQCGLPTVRSYSDGGGIFWVEEFIGYPEKLFPLSDYVTALVYLFSIIILDIREQKIIAAYETGYGIVSSFHVMDPHTICFSAGVSTYIVDIDYDADNS